MCYRKNLSEEWCKIGREVMQNDQKITDCHRLIMYIIKGVPANTFLSVLKIIFSLLIFLNLSIFNISFTTMCIYEYNMK